MGTWSWDTATGRVEWDSATEALYGLEPGTFPGRTRPTSSGSTPKTGRAPCAGSTSRSTPARFTDPAPDDPPDGVVRWIEGWGRVVKDADGKAVGLVGVSMDVTERVELELQRSINQERLTRLQEVTSALSDALTVSDVGEVGIRQLVAATGGLAATMYLMDERRGVLDLLSTTLPDELTLPEGRHLSVETSRCRPRAPSVSGVSFGCRSARPRGPRQAPPAQLISPDTPAEVWAFPIVGAAAPVGAVVLVFEIDPVEEAGRETLPAHDRPAGRPGARAGPCARRRADGRARGPGSSPRPASYLSSSLDFEETIGRVAEAAVPEFADWCSVELLDPDGQLRSLAVTHADPAKVEMARRLRERFPPDLDAPSGIGAVIRTGVPELVPAIPAS